MAFCLHAIKTRIPPLARISSDNPCYIAPFGFTGVTTLNYNSANNTNISDPDKPENGTGITYGLGLSFKFGQISPGFIIGWDHGLGSQGSGFIYSDKVGSASASTLLLHLENDHGRKQ